MKNLFIVALILSGLLLSGSTYGQKRVDTITYPSEKVIVETDSVSAVMTSTRYMYNTFWENWYVSAGAGGQIYFGDQDAMKPVGKRITATYEASIGKWIHPAVGLRAKVGGGLVKGYSDGKLPSIGHSMITGSPDANGIYTQRWHQLYFEGDVLVDLSNAIGGYNPDRFYSPIVFVGAGIDYAQNQPKSDGDRTAMATMGVINRFRISRYFDANLEIKNAIVDQTFDREQSQKYYESFLAATIGLTYHFGSRNNLAFSKGAARNTTITRTYTHIPNIPAAEKIISSHDTLVKQETVREVTVEKKLVLTHPIAIFFELDKSEITDRSKVNLAFVADIIKSSGGGRFRLIGSADNKTAHPAYNQELSERRCQSVRNYLVQVLIVDPQQLIMEPIGGIDRFKSTRVNRAVIISAE